MNESIEARPNQSPSLKQRHGCLTAYLVFMIIANSATSLIYLTGSESIRLGTKADKMTAHHTGKTYTFDEIKAMHEQAKSQGMLLGQQDLQGFTRIMQVNDPQNDWSQGLLPDNWAGNVSRKINNLAFPVLIVGAVCNLVCAIALLRWKKWGFWGFVGSASVVFVVNLTIGLGLVPALSGLLGVVILYGVLHIGKERKGWSQLE
jgi:hypothetical protein